MPDGPVAQPALGATSSTARVRVQVRPLGQVGYDGQVLPLVSPDGRFIAVEGGEAPTWETLLAARGAAVPLRTTVIVYSLAGAAPVPVVFGTPLPTGAVLGRGCGDEGFLVEWPRPDGARWIGLADWLSGGITWLARGDAVNAHAVLTPGGELLYTRGDGYDAPRQLVLRRRDGSEDVRSDAGESYTFPMTTGDTTTVFTLIESPAGLDVAAIALTPDPAAAGRTSLGAVVARARLTGPSGAEMAYQVAAGAAPALPVRSTDPGAPARDLLLLVPRAQRLGRFDPARAGFDLFPPNTVAAALSAGDPPGYFAATPDGLVFVADRALRDAAGTASAPGAAPVLGDPYVPRATTNPERPYILIGPVPRDPLRLRIVAMAVAPPES
ncbi:MAG: hypothetical protein IT437_05210 [Phycisphaerales bacterium]|nr:hypothetical protein [Phycisphaerales bacterium]